jgi:hypothetical protein
MDKGRIISIILFFAGLTVAIIAGILLFLGIISSYKSAIIGIIGIGLIGASNFRLLK